jgi:TolB-like protein
VISGVLGGLALIGLSLWGFSRRPVPSVTGSADATAAAPLSSIAVMYLEDRSDGGTLGHLSAGLTEDLIDQLAAVNALRVISPDGVRPYRGKSVPLDSLVHVFHVGTVVTGSLRAAHNKLRASIRLTDAVNGVQLYGGTFEQPFRNVLELRDEMAGELARQLRIRLGEAVQLQQRRAGASSAAAWELVRRAEQLRDQALDLAEGDVESSQLTYRQADSLLVVAERLDPAWTEPPILRGWLAMGRADLAAGAVDTAGAPGRALAAAWIRRGIEQANRVLQRNRNEPEALELRGTLRYEGWKITGFSGPSDSTMGLELAERDLRTAASVPGRHQGRALSTLSAVLQFAGKLDESHLQAQRAYEADAYLRDASAILFRLFHTSLELKRYPEAAEWCERGRTAFPRDWLFLFCQLRLLAWSPPVTPDVGKAWNVLGQLDSMARGETLAWLKPQMTLMVAAVLARRGLADSAERVIARAKSATAVDPELRYYEALARVRLKQDTIAARLLAELLRQGPNFRPVLRSHTEFQSLWSDPQLQAWR